MADKKPGKLKLIREDVKERHTSHWDLDYLSREELERLMTKKPVTNSTDQSPGQANQADDDRDDEDLARGKIDSDDPPPGKG